jgi:hypothetical protein
MGFGFGKVPTAQWEQLKSGDRQDRVAPGDYFARFSGLRHIDPSKSEKGLGAYVMEFVTTERNQPQNQGKRFESRVSYHPNPTAENYQQMNEISAGKMAQLIAASAADPLVGPDGLIDLVRTLEWLKGTQPEVLGTVEHRTYEGKTYQDFTTFRAVA